MSDCAIGEGMPEKGSKPHEMLLKVVQYFRTVDRVDMSLRQIAEGVGTSHRMLGYYFGTREQLLGLVMVQLSAEYIAKFDGRRPTTRVEVIQATQAQFRDPNNRLQTQLLFILASAAAERPEIEIPALRSDLDNLAAALTGLGIKEGLAADRAAREARLIVATNLGLFLDFYITKGSPELEENYRAFTDWVSRSTATPD